MRKLVSILPLFILFGCSFSRTAETDEAGIRAKYRELTTWNVEAEVAAEFPGYVSTYLLEFSHQTDGESRVTVLEPETIAGITVNFDGATPILSVGETRLEAGDLGGISPVTVLPRLLRIWESCASEIETVTESGEEFLITVHEEEELLYRTVFSRETYVPIRAEVFRAGECVLRIRFVP